MLEILVLSVLSPNIAARARHKGRAALPFVFLLLGCWVWGQLLGGFAGAAFAIMLGYEPDLLLAYVTSWVGAIAGTVVAFKKVNAVPIPTSHMSAAAATTTITPVTDRDNYEHDDHHDRDRGWGPIE